MAETTTAAAPMAASRSRPAPPTCRGDDQQHAGKAGGQGHGDAPVEPLAEQVAPSRAVSTGEMKLSAMASASGSRASAKKKVVAVTTMSTARMPL